MNMSSSTLHWYLIILLITWSLEKVETQDQQNGLEEDCLQAISTYSQVVNPATKPKKILVAHPTHQTRDITDLLTKLDEVVFNGKISLWSQWHSIFPIFGG